MDLFCTNYPTVSPSLCEFTLFWNSDCLDLSIMQSQCKRCILEHIFFQLSIQNGRATEFITYTATGNVNPETENFGYIIVLAE